MEPYVPAVLNAPTSFLVVDGFINGNGATRIKLSRTTNVTATTTPPAEKGARLFIIDNMGGRYALSEKTPGFYRSDSLLLPIGRQYQLRITTATNATYESALVPLLTTPIIDKLTWQLNGDKVAVLLNTHDASAQARFYRWSFVETWEFNAGFRSEVEYFPTTSGPGRIDKRVTPIYTCWRTERPTNIKQTSTAQLSQNALTDFNLFDIATRAERLKIRYSVLVSQVAETAEEFAYYEQLRKNTEAVGTVNDPLPTQLTGNVRRTDNAAEPVLGFVSAHTLQQQRLFIDHTQLPYLADYQYDTPYKSCIASNVYFCVSQGSCDAESVIKLFATATNIPLDGINDPNYGLGYSAASADCADCRTRGTTTKPKFW
ncbi:DUF4249 domain-containing protein [Hymenobacter arcticus]